MLDKPLWFGLIQAAKLCKQELDIVWVLSTHLYHSVQKLSLWHKYACRRALILRIISIRCIDQEIVMEGSQPVMTTFDILVVRVDHPNHLE